MKGFFNGSLRGIENLHWNITWHLTTGNDKTQKRADKRPKISCRYLAKCFRQAGILKGCLKLRVLHEVYLRDKTPYRWVRITNHLLKEQPGWILMDAISAAFLTVAPFCYFHITCHALTCYVIFPHRKALAVLMTSSPVLCPNNNFHQPIFMTSLMHFGR